MAFNTKCTQTIEFLFAFCLLHLILWMGCWRDDYDDDDSRIRTFAQFRISLEVATVPVMHCKPAHMSGAYLRKSTGNFRCNAKNHFVLFDAMTSRDYNRQINWCMRSVRGSEWLVVEARWSIEIGAIRCVCFAFTHRVNCALNSVRFIFSMMTMTTTVAAAATTTKWMNSESISGKFSFFFIFCFNFFIAYFSFCVDRFHNETCVSRRARERNLFFSFFFSLIKIKKKNRKKTNKKYVAKDVKRVFLDRWLSRIWFCIFFHFSYRRMAGSADKSVTIRIQFLYFCCSVAITIAVADVVRSLFASTLRSRF